MSDAVPPDRRPRGAERRGAPPLSRESPQVPDDRRRRLRRRRVLAAALIVVVVAVFVAGTVVALNTVAHQFQSGAAAAALPAVTGQPTSPATVVPQAVTPSATPSSSVAAAPVPPAPPAFDKSAFSIDDPNSPWVVVNKLRPIAGGADFVPPNLTNMSADMPDPNHFPLQQVAEDALHSMFAADHAEVGTQLVAQSGYRSYSRQVTAYAQYVKQLGVTGADRTSARPGFSEHQTGLAMDILDTVSGCATDYDCFGKTVSGQWLAANAYRFGFILRYPADKTAVTGYEYEPWHFRYVGVDLSTEMHNTGVETLEEFFGLPAAPDYAG